MLEKQLPLQPYIIVVGLVLSDITESYVAIDTALYSVDSTQEALDVCFKAFHVLHARYPPESHHISMMIQKGLYDCCAEWDSLVPHVEGIISRYKSYQKEISINV